MASGSVELRDKVRGTGVIQKAIGFLQNQNVCVVESAAFLLCSLVRGEKPRFFFFFVLFVCFFNFIKIHCLMDQRKVETSTFF